MQQELEKVRTPRAYRPLLSIEPVVKTVVRRFEIKETAALLISHYAQFMSERSGCVVKEDSVVEHLALLIGKDKGFRAWAFNQDQAGSKKAGT
jgi:hypothetical protein